MAETKKVKVTGLTPRPCPGPMVSPSTRSTRSGRMVSLSKRSVPRLRSGLVSLSPSALLRTVRRTVSLSNRLSKDGVEPLTKEQIRSKILLRLKTQKEEDRDRKSRIIKKKLFRTLVFRKAKIVMFYISFDGEVNTQEMVKQAQNLGKTVTAPVCKRNRTIRPCILQDKARLKKGPYGICEPVVQRFVKREDLDLVIVPGVAFDRRGNRLGRGKGYYDRFLKKLPNEAISFGLAFDFQILPSLPATKTDVSVNKVIFA